MNQSLRRAAYRTGMFLVSLALVAVLWELYKVVGPEKGGKLFGISILPRSNDSYAALVGNAESLCRA